MDLADLADLLLFEAPDFRHIPNRSGEESVFLHWDTFGPNGRFKIGLFQGRNKERWVFINDTLTLDEFCFDLQLRQYTEIEYLRIRRISVTMRDLFPNAVEVLEQAAAA